MSEADAGTTVVFYDGTCGLCNGFVQFVIARDRAGRIRFAPLQGEAARRELAPLGHDPADLDTVFVIAEWQTPRQQVMARSRAVLHVAARLGGPSAALARIAQLIPRPIADLAYEVVARYRYRVFGRLDACPIPPREWRERFIDG